ncbi:MAG TPA: hypothetical protein DD662_05530, partial [Planctomycetaceae bacterium]|nr:hypothetical protein [Planctomycetaceae bacterium]
LRRHDGVIPAEGKKVFGRLRGSEKIMRRKDQNLRIKKKQVIREPGGRNQNGIKAGKAGCF